MLVQLDIRCAQARTVVALRAPVRLVPDVRFRTTLDPTSRRRRNQAASAHGIGRASDRPAEPACSRPHAGRQGVGPNFRATKRLQSYDAARVFGWCRTFGSRSINRPPRLRIGSSNHLPRRSVFAQRGVCRACACSGLRSAGRHPDATAATDCPRTARRSGPPRPPPAERKVDEEGRDDGDCILVEQCAQAHGASLR